MITRTNVLPLRAFLFFIILCVLYLGIIVNLYCIQIRNTTFFAQLGSQQYVVVVNQPPPRAPILDRNYKELAINHDCLSAFIVPNKVTDLHILSSFLAEHFPHAAHQLSTHRHKHFMYVQRNVSPEQVDLIRNAPTKEVHLVRESSRFYPVACVGSVVGKTDIDNKGVVGIELSHEHLLAGIPTGVFLYKDARSGYCYFKKETVKPGKEGTPLILTIDSTLQFLVTEELKRGVVEVGGHYGCALIMDSSSGEILCMTTWPHFDPNSATIDSWELTKNRVITDAYELGSVIKVFAALAALEEGVVKDDELIDCKQAKTVMVDGRTINTWKAHGALSFADVIAFSNNIGIALVAKRVGEALYYHYGRLGFGRKTGIQLPGEHKGMITHPSQWSKQSLISLSYGYEIAATLLQVGCALSIIARNGYWVTPTIIREQSNTHDNRIKEKDTRKLYSDNAIAAIKRILERTTQTGTAKQAALAGYRIMSKTGTANQLVNGVYDENKNIFTCAGIIEKDDYQRVVVVFIKNAERKNVYASTIVAPLFAHIVQKMVIHERII